MDVYGLDVEFAAQILRKTLLCIIIDSWFFFYFWLVTQWALPLLIFIFCKTSSISSTHIFLGFLLIILYAGFHSLLIINFFLLFFFLLLDIFDDYFDLSLNLLDVIFSWPSAWWYLSLGLRISFFFDSSSFWFNFIIYLGVTFYFLRWYATCCTISNVDITW